MATIGVQTSAEQATGADLAARYRGVRRTTEALCEPLEPEDFGLQSMPDASPPKWHLAHSSWFFETFVLAAAAPSFRPFHPKYSLLFNSYYNAVGERIERTRRGLLSRPTIAEVRRYRAFIDEAMVDLLERGDAATLGRLAPVVELGLNHEQQHQELLLTDLKHALAWNPLRPAYREGVAGPSGGKARPLEWSEYPEGLRWIGHGGDGFAFDNEGPRHRQFVGAFRLAMRPATVGEYLGFLADGGYERPELWLSEGWATRGAEGWRAPLYWERDGEGWKMATLGGLRDLDEAEPVCHLSYFEADAFARWSGARLPTEAEWEVAAEGRPVVGNLLESGHLHPVASRADGQEPSALFGDVWEWTASPYSAYPGYRPAAGALGEYNGKFMCSQLVLRGGSCATPGSHVRATYRNFFGPSARWQFSGVRLAVDA